MRLPELQQRCLERFAALTTNDESFNLESIIHEGSIASSTRIAVYENNITEIVTGTLRNVYPAIEQLVGDACFRSLARSYLESNASHSGDLQSYGKDFWSLLDSIYGNTEHEFLADIARLEFAIDECLTEADEPCISGEQLQAALLSEDSEIMLALNPSFHMVRSQYPILDIWRAHRDNAMDGLSLDSNRQNVVIVRRGSDAQLTPVGDNGATLIRSLAQGSNIDDALIAAGEINADQLAGALRDIVNSCAFVRVIAQ